MVVAVPSLRNVARVVATMLGNQAKNRGVDRSQLQPLIVPYTNTASMVQFDWVYFYKQCWWPRYWLYANILCFPLWVWIDFQVNSPEAKLAWENKKKLDFKKEHLKEWEWLD